MIRVVCSVLGAVIAAVLAADIDATALLAKVEVKHLLTLETMHCNFTVYHPGLCLCVFV